MIKKQIRNWLVNAYLLSLVEMEIAIRDRKEAESEKYRAVSSEFGIITDILEYQLTWDMFNHWRKTEEIFLLESDVTDLSVGNLLKHITEEFSKDLSFKLFNHSEHILGKHAVRALSLLSEIPMDTIIGDIVSAYEETKV